MSAEALVDGQARVNALSNDPRQFVAMLLGDLVVDPDGQRVIDQERVRRIAHAFSWLRFEIVTVVMLTDGRARVIEGQHRVLGARLIFPPDTIVMCAVLPIDVDPIVEAEVAYEIATGRRGHNAMERWRLRVTMGHPHELAAERALAERHLRLGTSPDPTTIAAVNTISTLIHGRRRPPDAGAELLGRTVDILGYAFPADNEASGSRWDGRLLRAIGELLAGNDAVDEKRLIAVLAGRESTIWVSKLTDVPNQRKWETLRYQVSANYNHGLPKMEWVE